jgi:hypothetical protein
MSDGDSFDGNTALITMADGRSADRAAGKGRSTGAGKVVLFPRTAPPPFHRPPKVHKTTRVVLLRLSLDSPEAHLDDCRALCAFLQADFDCLLDKDPAWRVKIRKLKRDLFDNRS